jgi:glutamine cyclotransferase
VLFFVVLAGCSDKPREQTENINEQVKPAVVARQLKYTVVRRLAHDTNAFTQGLEVYKGLFLESTGQYGFSGVRRVDINTGKTVKSTPLPQQYFGEGITQLNGKIYMLTWLNQQGFIFDATTLSQTGTFTYSGEGWGITNDGRYLYLSNGTGVITVIDPVTWMVIRSITVSIDGMAVSNINELEWINGMIWANVWRSDKVLQIDPANGIVTGVLDLTGILPTNERTTNTDVLNGIAWDSTSKTIYVTGKNWPAVFELTVQ